MKMSSRNVTAWGLLSWQIFKNSKSRVKLKNHTHTPTQASGCFCRVCAQFTKWVGKKELLALRAEEAGLLCWCLSLIPFGRLTFDIYLGRFSLPELKQNFTHFRLLSSKIFSPAVKTILNLKAGQALTTAKNFIPS